MSVSLNLSVPAGQTGWAGDLYAYVQHGPDLAVLLNRPGRTSGTPFGYGDSQSFTMSFTDGAANGDIHAYRSVATGSDTIALTGPLTGVGQADGRITDPLVVLGTDSRTALLGSFTGGSAAGDWTLFLADLSGGGRYQLDSWSLSVTAVPEPGALGIFTAAGLVAFTLWRRARKAWAGC